MFLYFLLSVLSAYNSAPAMFDLAARDEPLCPESCKCPLKRTLFGITWSCLSTIILCAWTAVHPNVPPRSTRKALWNRLKLMYWMVIAPELVLAWAVRQFFAAKDIRDAYNNSRVGEKSPLRLEACHTTNFEQECRPGTNGRWHMATYLAWGALP